MKCFSIEEIFRVFELDTWFWSKNRYQLCVYCVVFRTVDRKVSAEWLKQSVCRVVSNLRTIESRLISVKYRWLTLSTFFLTYSSLVTCQTKEKQEMWETLSIKQVWKLFVCKSTPHVSLGLSRNTWKFHFWCFLSLLLLCWITENHIFM